jgi:hypothetical protein
MEDVVEESTLERTLVVVAVVYGCGSVVVVDVFVFDG